MEDSGHAGELVVEDFFETFAAFAIGENEVAVFNGADGEGGDASDVADEVCGGLSLGVIAEVGLPEDEAGGESLGGDGEFLGTEIFGEVEGEKAAVFVVIENGGVVDGDVALEELAGEGDLLACEVQDLLIGPVEGGGEADGEIVAEAVLGEGDSIAVHNLASGGGDVELEGAGLLLGFPCGLGIFHDGGLIEGRGGELRFLGDEESREQGGQQRGWKYPTH